MNKQDLLDVLNKVMRQRKIEGSFSSGVKTGLEVAITLVKQLDEPRVLSQEWIDKNVIHIRGLGDVLKVEDVESILIPNKGATSDTERGDGMNAEKLIEALKEECNEYHPEYEHGIRTGFERAIEMAEELLEMKEVAE